MAHATERLPAFPPWLCAATLIEACDAKSTEPRSAIRFTSPPLVYLTRSKKVCAVPPTSMAGRGEIPDGHVAVRRVQRKRAARQGENVLSTTLAPTIVKLEPRALAAVPMDELVAGRKSIAPVAEMVCVALWPVISSAVMVKSPSNRNEPASCSSTLLEALK